LPIQRPRLFDEVDKLLENVDESIQVIGLPSLS